MLLESTVSCNSFVLNTRGVLTMNEIWLGKRKHCLRYLSAAQPSARALEQAAALLRASREEQESMMEDTLARVCARARQSPVYAHSWAKFAQIRGLCDLTQVPCTSSNALPKMTDQAPDWSKWMADGDAVLATAATGGSSGISRVMPYTQRSVTHCSRSNLPYLAQFTIDYDLPAKRMALALTAPTGYVSHLMIPDYFLTAGYDVLHVPLASLLGEPEIAQDLIDWLLERGNEIHTISTVTAMLPVFLTALEAQPRGVDALDRLRSSLRYLYTAGSELTPTLHTMISDRLGLAAGAHKNFFASTEACTTASTHEDYSLFQGSLHSHVLSLLPMSEVEKSESDPDYAPKGVLLTRAPVGLVGELACTFDTTVPWINLRQGDVFEVEESATAKGCARLSYKARMSSVQDVGGGRVWPSSYARAMDKLDGKVADYLAMAMKPGDPILNGSGSTYMKDTLMIYYEGAASVDDVADSIFDAIPMLATTGPQLGVGTYDMTIANVRSGALRRCRQQKSQERGGSPGPLKHQVVRGPQYNVPQGEIVAMAPRWTPAPRFSGIRPPPVQANHSVPSQERPDLASLAAEARDKAG
jgi:hypothetical protein